MIFKCSFGGGSNAEVKMVLHSAVFVWLVRENWILPLSEICNEWAPVDLFRFMRVKKKDWRVYLTSGGFTAQELQSLETLADQRELELSL